MEKSNYLEAFKKLTEKNTDNKLFELIGDNILIEKIDEEEFKSSSGIIMATDPKQSRNNMLETKPCWVRILAVGAGYYDGDKEVPLSVKPGDVCLIPEAGARWFSVFGEYRKALSRQNTIGLTTEAEIQLRFKGESGYEEAFKILNETSE